MQQINPQVTNKTGAEANGTLITGVAVSGKGVRGVTTKRPDMTGKYERLEGKGGIYL